MCCCTCSPHLLLVGDWWRRCLLFRAAKQVRHILIILLLHQGVMGQQPCTCQCHMHRLPLSCCLKHPACSTHLRRIFTHICQ
jgi:hypothetical protein